MRSLLLTAWREFPAAAQGGGQAEPGRLQVAMRSGEDMAPAVCRAGDRRGERCAERQLGKSADGGWRSAHAGGNHPGSGTATPERTGGSSAWCSHGAEKYATTGQTRNPTCGSSERARRGPDSAAGNNHEGGEKHACYGAVLPLYVSGTLSTSS